MSKCAPTYDMSVCQGSDFSFIMRFLDENSLPIDITGYSFEGQIRSSISSPVIAASFAFTILDQGQPETIGMLSVSLPASETTAIEIPEQSAASRTTVNMPYDIESTISGNDKRRRLQGIVKLSPEVTR